LHRTDEETAMPLPPLETTRYDVEDGIATITLHRPEKLNAYNGQMRVELGLLFDETDADDEVKAVIVTGAGRAFCAGADLSSGGDTFDRAAPQNHAYLEKLRVGDVYRDGGGTNTLRIYESLKPVIGAINGPAVGIGATIQLPMDMRLASTSARFGWSNICSTQLMRDPLFTWIRGIRSERSSNAPIASSIPFGWR